MISRWVFLIFTFLWSNVAFCYEISSGYIVFDDKSEAAKEAMPHRYWGYIPFARAKKRYRQAEELIAPIFEALCKRYENCDTIPSLEVVLSYHNDSHTIGLEHEDKQYQTNALVLSMELLKEPEQFEFVVAHELIHYFEKHGEVTTLNEEITSIRRQVGSKCVDYDEPHEVVGGNLIELVNLMEELGEKPQIISTSVGLAFDGELNSLLERMLFKSLSHGKSCIDAKLILPKLKEHYKRGSYLTGLNSDYLKFKEEVIPCFEAYDGNLLKDIVEEKGLFTELPKDVRTKLAAIIDNESLGTELERLQLLRNSRYAEFTRLSRELSAPQLRFQTNEDVADVMAVNLLLDMGKKNVASRLEYLLAGSPTVKQIRCKDDLEKNREPDYGPLNKKHHDECWRIWRAQKIEQRRQE